MTTALAVTGPSQAAPPTSVTGVVWRDVNGNGTRDTGEGGIAGVSISAVDDAGTTYGPATSGADGTYSIVSAPSGVALRVHASGFGGAAGSALASLHPAPGRSDTQFIPVAGPMTADFGLWNPADYCQSSPLLVTTCFIAGDTSSNVSDYSLHTFTTSLAATTTKVVKAQNQGATYGVAYNRKTNQTLTSAFVKRHAGLGPQGIGGIYAVNAVSGAQAWAIDVSTLGVTTGSIGSNAARGLGAPTDPSADPTAYALVGKAGLGDIEVAEDNASLWFTSFADNKLYNLALPSDGSAPSAPATGVAVSSVCDHPFAVAPHDGLVYVGVACSSGAQAQIVAYNPVSHAWTSVLTIPLSGRRGCAYFNIATTDPNSCVWNAWSDTPFNGSTDYYVVNPQPMFADLTFGADGSINVGLRDRNGDQHGLRQLNPAGSFPVLTGLPFGQTGLSAGDILHICNVNGTLTLEGVASCPSNAANGQGPGGAEYYPNDRWDLGGGEEHQETSLGGLTQVGDRLYVTSFDPSAIWAGGVNAFDITTGAKTGQTTAYKADPVITTGVDYGVPNSYFGKANGMGDIEALCDQAPIEIGNRVWVDANRDGIQDPSESPVSGATVTLYAANGTTVLATATTDTAGRYVFSSAASGPLATGTYNVSALTEGAVVVIGAPLTNSTNVLTKKTGTIEDPYNSDVDPTTGKSAQITIGAAGFNDHNYDIGYAAPGYSLGNRVWNDANDNSMIDGSEAGISGATVELLDASGASIDPDGSGPLTATTTTTSATGYYRFDDLTGGTYRVKVTAPAGYVSSTTDESDPNLDVDAVAATASDNGVGTANVATSGPITLGPSGATEPTSESDLAPSGQGTTDAFANMTVDFGFHPVVSVGDHTWIDTNSNGQQDSGEPALAGVNVTLYAPDCSTIQATTTTDSNGFYVFTGLLPGSSHVIGFSLPSGYSRTVATTGATATDSNPNVTTGCTAVFTAPSTGSNSAVTPDDPTIDAGYVAVTPPSSTTTVPPSSTTTVPPSSTTTVPPSSTTTTTSTTTIPSSSTTTTTLGEGTTTTTTAPASTTTTTVAPSPGPAPTTTVPNIPVLVQSPTTTTTTVAPTTTAAPTTTTTPPPTIVTTTTAAPLAPVTTAAPATGQIGDAVWHDKNCDGVQDPGEGGIVNAKLVLRPADGSSKTATSDANGGYLFDGLVPGNYTVDVLAKKTPSNGGATRPVGLGAGQSSLGIDFGFCDISAVEGATATPDSPIAFTGSNTNDLATLAFGMLAAGGGLVIVSRRKRRPSRR